MIGRHVRAHKLAWHDRMATWPGMPAVLTCTSLLHKGLLDLLP
jgi:hypothetical protein